MVNLSRSEACWLYFLSKFGITKLVLENGRIHVLHGVMPRVPRSSSPSDVELNIIHTLSIELSGHYQELIETDQAFGPICRSLMGSLLEIKVQFERITRIIDQFYLAYGHSIYNNSSRNYAICS